MSPRAAACASAHCNNFVPTPLPRALGAHGQFLDVELAAFGVWRSHFMPWPQQYTKPRTLFVLSSIATA